MGRWKEDHWPPTFLRQFQSLPIYYGNYDEVFAYREKLFTATGLVSDHIADKDGYIPRWLEMPKFEFGVQRLNLVSVMGKASLRFSAVDKLMEKCGLFDSAAQLAMARGLIDNPDHFLVAHRPIQDMRAYMFTNRDHEPKRERFMRHGLVLAVEEGFTIQDHTRQFQNKRSDAYSDPIAKNATWAVYVKPARIKKKQVP